GLEGEKEFTRVLLGDELELDVDLAREEHVRVARRLVAEHPDLGAIVLECTNMPPYTADIQRETGRPVFDITTLVRLAHDRRAARPGRSDPLAGGSQKLLCRDAGGIRKATTSRSGVWLAVAGRARSGGIGLLGVASATRGSRAVRALRSH